MLTIGKQARKAVGIMPIAVIAAMLMTACGGTAATSTTVPATVAPTAMMAGETPTAMMAGTTPTTMMAGETPTAMMAGETPTAMMAGQTPSAMMGTPGAMMAPITVQLNALNNSGQTGTVSITKVSDADVMVSVNLSNGTTESQPAHIHKGTCANLDPKPAYPLTNVVNGKSDTEVMVSMSDLEKGPYAINIHKSAAEASTYVACGDITASMMGSATPGAMMSTPGAMMAPITVQLNALNNSGESGTAILGASATGDTVMITLSNGTTEPQPAHIHKGTCANLDPTPLVPLTNVVNGKSETTITGGITTMVAGQAYAINVHKSAADISTYVACGDIPASMTGSSTPGAMMGTPGAMTGTTPVATP